MSAWIHEDMILWPGSKTALSGSGTGIITPNTYGKTRIAIG
ncbi:hypothetical protein OG562_26905 [Streptomyces sp. NBC_01275]|nr:hypothetical protein [Streptomyces sp. NBC_01275]MCX4764527.1 hypothetical protein [Streptomyces sp. NBC_01275]